MLRETKLYSYFINAYDSKCDSYKKNLVLEQDSKIKNPQEIMCINSKINF